MHAHNFNFGQPTNLIKKMIYKILCSLSSSLLLLLPKCSRFHVCLIFYRLMPSPPQQVSIEWAKRLGGVDRLIRNITFYLHVFSNFFLLLLPFFVFCSFFPFNTTVNRKCPTFCTHIILHNHSKSRKKSHEPNSQI